MRKKLLLFGLVLMLLVSCVSAASDFTENAAFWMDSYQRTTSLSSFTGGPIGTDGGATNFTGVNAYISVPNIIAVSTYNCQIINSTGTYTLTSTCPVYNNSGVYEIGKTGAATYYNDSIVYMQFLNSVSNQMYLWNGSQLTDWTGNGNNGQTSNFRPLNLTNESFIYDGFNDYIRFGNDSSIDIVDDTFTIGAWFKTNTVSGVTRMITFPQDNGVAGQIKYGISIEASKIRFAVDTGVQTTTDVNPFIDTTDWHLVVGVYNSTHILIYLDGVLNSTNPLTGNVASNNDGIASLGSFSTTYPQNFNGDITTGFIFNDSKNATWVADLYAEDRGFNPFDVAPATNFRITAFDIYDNASLTSFFAEINGTVYNDSGTGTIITGLLTNDTNLYNITVYKTNYFNRTYLNQAITSNLQAQLIGTNVTFRVVLDTSGLLANISNTTLKDFNNSLNFTSSTGIFNINPTANETLVFQVESGQSEFLTTNFTFKFNGSSNVTINLSVNSTLNVLTFTNVNGTAISSASVDITYPSGSTITETTNSSGQVAFSYIYNNAFEFGTYNFSFTRSGYNAVNFSEDINSSNVPFYKSYNASQTTITINVYDRTTLALLNTTTSSIAILGLLNTTTSNGTVVISNVSILANTYTAQAGASGYSTETLVFTYDAETNVVLNFYLLNLTGATTGTLFIQVIDEFYNRLKNVEVELMEYVPANNGFVTISQCQSNSIGECAFFIELNTKRYIARATTTIEGAIFSDTTSATGEIFVVNNEVRQLLLRTEPDFISSGLNNLVYSINETFVNNISSVEVEFQTINGLPETVCVGYYLINTFNATLENENCTTGTGGISNVDNSFLLNRSNTYEARVYLLTGTTRVVLDSFRYNSVTSWQQILEDNEYISPFILALYVSLIAVALYLKNIGLFFYFAPILAWATVIWFPSFAVSSVAVTITVISFMMLFVSRKRRESS